MAGSWSGSSPPRCSFLLVPQGRPLFFPWRRRHSRPIAFSCTDLRGDSVGEPLFFCSSKSSDPLGAGVFPFGTVPFLVQAPKGFAQSRCRPVCAVFFSDCPPPPFEMGGRARSFFSPPMAEYPDRRILRLSFPPPFFFYPRHGWPRATGNRRYDLEPPLDRGRSNRPTPGKQIFVRTVLYSQAMTILAPLFLVLSGISFLKIIAIR